MNKKLILNPAFAVIVFALVVLLLQQASSFAHAAGSGGSGTNPTPQAGAPPFATPAPMTSWEIRIEYAPDRAAADRTPASATSSSTAPAQKEAPPVRPVSIRCERGTDIAHTVVLWSDGSRWEGYIQGNTVVQKNARSGKISSLSLQDEDFLSPLFVKGYSGTAWIAPNLYQGNETVDDTICFRYVRPPSPSPHGAIYGDIILPELTAWISAEDKIPSRVRLGDAVYHYSHPVALRAQPEVPADLAKFLTQVRQQERALELLRKSSR